MCPRSGRLLERNYRAAREQVHLTEAVEYPEGMNVAARVHVAVLSDEVLHWLAPRPGQTLVDGTLGAGGHTRLMAERVGSSGRVIALDRDAAALSAAEKNLAGMPIAIAQANFCDLGEVLAEVGVERVDGILLDLGLSSDQLADADRGFSFDSTGELDLRFDTDSGEPAWRLIERLDADQLADILFRYGEERLSRRIARRIVEARQIAPLRSAEQLAQVVRRAIGPTAEARRIDSATRTFQALRIAVNDELKSLELALERLPALLAPEGRLAIISFHSLEDRLVKEAFRGDPRLTALTKKPLRPTDEEIARNPRSRSAKLRVAQRVGA
jgi:16S rRNA (cytosine1402-N4)-methyltransferase